MTNIHSLRFGVHAGPVDIPYEQVAKEVSMALMMHTDDLWARHCTSSRTTGIGSAVAYHIDIHVSARMETIWLED